jgi:hypothetical protein
VRYPNDNSELRTPGRNDASNDTSDARFEVPAAVLLKIQSFWDGLCHWVTLSVVKRYSNTWVQALLEKYLGKGDKRSLENSEIIYQTTKRNIAEESMFTMPENSEMELMFPFVIELPILNTPPILRALFFF